MRQTPDQVRDKRSGISRWGQKMQKREGDKERRRQNLKKRQNTPGR